MLGPIIMLNKISSLILTVNIVKAKLHRRTHMSTTEPTSRPDALSGGPVERPQS